MWVKQIRDFPDLGVADWAEEARLPEITDPPKEKNKGPKCIPEAYFHFHPEVPGQGTAWLPYRPATRSDQWHEMKQG